MSGRQDSNLRPPGPKPGALPTAPRPENRFFTQSHYPVISRCKVTAFFITSQLILNKILKKSSNHSEKRFDDPIISYAIGYLILVAILSISYISVTAIAVTAIAVTAIAVTGISSAGTIARSILLAFYILTIDHY